ncbi:MAG: SigE family RNA polymerase sigma factor [Actinomycetota bacterium]
MDRPPDHDAEPPAFDEFYRREYPRLAVLATAVSGDPSTGEDLAQEALTRAGERWDQVSAYDNPGTWVRRVTINLATSRRRRLRNEARALLRLGPPSAVPGVTLHGDPEVWSAVASLPPRQRAVVTLHHLEDRPVAEIADTLGISVSAATSNLHKARRRLAEALGNSDRGFAEGSIR